MSESEHSPVEAASTTVLKPRSVGWRPALMLLLVGAAAYTGWQFADTLSLSSLAAHEAELLDYGRRHAIGVCLALFGLYIVVTAASIPAATALTFLSAWLFQRLFGPVQGFFGAALLVSVASSIGATIAFLISRHLLGTTIRSRYADAVARFDESLERDGLYYLLTLRLTPVVPFWLVNLAMGLTKIPTKTFWWVSQLGMLPATFIFVFAGSQVPSLATLERQGVWDVLWPGPLVALLLLAAFPWIVRWLLSPRRKWTASDEATLGGATQFDTSGSR